MATRTLPPTSLSLPRVNSAREEVAEVMSKAWHPLGETTSQCSKPSWSSTKSPALLEILFNVPAPTVFPRADLLGAVARDPRHAAAWATLDLVFRATRARLTGRGAGPEGQHGIRLLGDALDGEQGHHGEERWQLHGGSRPLEASRRRPVP
jgi:hypothetical protein